jgi:hypothetical protein
MYNTNNPYEAYAADVVLAHYESVVKLARDIAKKKSVAKDDRDVKNLKDQLERMLLLIDSTMKKNNWNYVAGSHLRSADFALFYIYA